MPRTASVAAARAGQVSIVMGMTGLTFVNQSRPLAFSGVVLAASFLALALGYWSYRLGLRTGGRGGMLLGTVGLYYDLGVAVLVVTILGVFRFREVALSSYLLILLWIVVGITLYVSWKRQDEEQVLVQRAGVASVVLAVAGLTFSVQAGVLGFNRTVLATGVIALLLATFARSRGRKIASIGFILALVIFYFHLGLTDLVQNLVQSLDLEVFSPAGYVFFVAMIGSGIWMAMGVTQERIPMPGYVDRAHIIPLKSGTRLHEQRYLIGELIGSGGFGCTYFATDLTLDRDVAVKEFYPGEAVIRDGEDRFTMKIRGPWTRGMLEAWKKRFLDEARILAKVDHPNVVRVFDFFEQHDTAYMVMEYLEGKSLRDHELEGQLPDDQVRAWSGPIVEALGALHKKDLLHLDVKPENIFITKSGRPVLLDFGAARRRAGMDALTEISYTAGFAAPEVVDQRWNKVGSHSDVFSMGATLYEMVTGKAPGAEPITAIIPPLWKVLILPALDPDPTRRPGDITEWWNTLAIQMAEEE